MRVMSDYKIINITEHQDMLNRYYDELRQKSITENILDTAIRKDGIFITSIALYDDTIFYVCKSNQRFLSFLKDEKGIRFEISEAELQRIIKIYDRMIVSLEQKIENNLSIEKFILNDTLREKIYRVIQTEVKIKQIDYDYEDYEYL